MSDYGLSLQFGVSVTPDGRDLAVEERRAGFHLVALGLAILGRTALHHVRDVDVLALHAHRLDHLVEQLSGAPNEGLALGVFVRSRAFAHDHQLGAGIAYAEDDVLPSLVQDAARAIANVFADGAQFGGDVAKDGERGWRGIGAVARRARYSRRDAGATLNDGRTALARPLARAAVCGSARVAETIAGS